MTHKVQITKIVCVTSSDSFSSNDEVFMLCQSDGGAPVRVPPPPFETVSLNDNDSWTFDGSQWPELFLEFETEVNITLWDQDHKLLPGGSDFLGNTSLTAGDSESPICVGNGSSSSYKIYFAQA